MFTNRGLMQCIADRVLVGVLRERAQAGHRGRYDVLGLVGAGELTQDSPRYELVAKAMNRFGES